MTARPAIVSLLIACTSLCGAQSTAERIDGIWAVATNRMLSQQDAWFDDGDFPACINLLKVEAEKFPADYDIWTNLGWMDENVDDYAGAEQIYATYRKNNPQDPDSSLPLGTFYFMRKEYAKVPELLEPAIKRHCHPNNFRVLAWSYEKQKMFGDAVRVLKLYVDQDPKDEQAKRNLARDEKKFAAQS